MDTRDRTLVDATEASRLTGLAKTTLYRLARQGHLRSFKVLRRALRFNRADLMRMVEERPRGTRTRHSSDSGPHRDRDQCDST